MFYAADALRHLAPTSLGQDLFFHRHSQGDFLWFGAAYAAAIQHLGLDHAAWALTLLSRLAWVAALAVWCATAAPRPQRHWLLAVLLCLPPGYGALSALNIAEPFATPRPWAEAAVLAALALAWRGRAIAAAVLAVLAMSLHPLMALGGVAVLVWMLPPRWRYPLLALALLLMAVGMAAGIEPLPRLRQFYDPAWWQIVEKQNPMTVASRWSAADFAHALLALLLLADAARLAARGSVPARMAAGLGLAGAVALLAWLWATEAHHVLLIQLQVWRILWLMQVLAPALWLAALARGEMASPSAAVWLLLGLAWLSETGAAPALGLLALWLLHAPPAWLQASRLRRWPLFAASLLALLYAFTRLEPLLNDPGLAVVSLTPEQAVARVLREPVVSLSLLALVTWTLARFGRVATVRRKLLIGTAGLTACAALVAWSAWIWREPIDADQRALASQAASLIPAGATVWSELGLQSTWLHLQRAQWVSYEQRAGALFSREAALTWQSRWTLLASLGLSGDGSHPRQTDARIVATLCAQPDLHVVMLAGDVVGADAVVRTETSTSRVSLFDCRKRRGAA